MIQVGDRGPDFELVDQQGRTFRLGAHLGQALVLAFYLFDFSPA